MMSLRLSLDDKYTINDAIDFIIDMSLDHLFLEKQKKSIGG